MAKTRSAAPAILLTTLPTITGVDVAGESSELFLLPPPIDDVLEDPAPEVTPVSPPAINAPSPPSVDVEVGSIDEVGE